MNTDSDNDINSVLEAQPKHPSAHPIAVSAVLVFACLFSVSPVFGNALLVSDNRSVSTTGSWQYHPFCCGSPGNGTWDVSHLPTPTFSSFNSTATATGFATLLDVFA